MSEVQGEEKVAVQLSVVIYDKKCVCTFIEILRNKVEILALLQNTASVLHTNRL